ncbi:hypothetical protein LTR37_000151 [Vermiconidia calcicola]|uniref:Uncharacterized protein n=1 Tax=Vermiconidia calcicola TaxID=1690605 RepID=A0ACC3NZH0_9PEZI|nr:hypothetical protein LTR37_000151 [Vermiconidia calcicola]
MASQHRETSTSFTIKKINKSTFVIREDDAYKEHPLIYVKKHPKVPLIVLGDTGCDEASEKHKEDRYIHLRDYIENYPIEDNDNVPLNPSGHRQYYIICTHCHYDHIGGISQFLEGGTTEIIASSAGKDFVESDLETHGQFKYVDRPAPYYNVTCWANSFERLKWPLWHEDEPRPFQTDLGIAIIHTPGHTPDSIAWYDHAEMHLSCGDSFYEEGEDGMPIIFPAEGNLIEWVFAMQKLLVFVRSENARAAKAAEENSKSDWVEVAKRVKVSCGHQNAAEDGEEILAALEKFSARVYRGDVPVVKKEIWHGEACYTWRDNEDGAKMSLQAPARLMNAARRFFNIDVE